MVKTHVYDSLPGGSLTLGPWTYTVNKPGSTTLTPSLFGKVSNASSSCKQFELLDNTDWVPFFSHLNCCKRFKVHVVYSSR